MQNIGERVQYFREVGHRIRLHPGPTSRIYSGHATMKHVSSPPQTKAYRYLAVKEKVPRFKSFVDGLNTETKQRIKKIGYMDV